MNIENNNNDVMRVEDLQNEGLLDRAKAKVAGAVAGAKQIKAAAVGVKDAVKNVATGKGGGLASDIKKAVGSVKATAQTTQFKTRTKGFIDKVKKEIAAFDKTIEADLKANPQLKEMADKAKADLVTLLANLEKLP